MADGRKPFDPTVPFDVTMPPEDARRHFQARLDAIVREIKTLPLCEKFRLLADFIEAGPKVDKSLTRSLARHAMAELEASK